jgi:CspA family cold shock protein
MQGTVKWFNLQKGFGFITDSEGKEHFVHHSSIVMHGFRHLNEDDIVNFELGTGNSGKEQAINVKPILTMKMVKDSLKEENLYVKEVKADANTVSMNTLGIKKGYMVVNENDVIQVGEQGMDFLNLAAYAGYDTEGLSA